MTPPLNATMHAGSSPDFVRLALPADDGVRALDLLADLARDLRPGVIFPVCFDALLCVRRTLRTRALTTPHLAGAARVDPLLCARLLRRANRGRRAEPVTGVRDALARLGAERAQRVARAVSCGQIGCARQLSHVDELSSRLWLHTLRTAAGAYVLARRLTSLDPDEAMTAGLLHDIGAFYLLDRLARRPSVVFDAQDIGALILEWHESVGEALLQSLGVPEVLIEAMRDHEQPRASTGMPHTLSDLVFSANVLAGGATELYDDPVCHVSQRPAPTRQRFAGLLPEIEQVFAALRRGAMQG